MNFRGIITAATLVVGLISGPTAVVANETDLETLTWQVVASSEDVAKIEAFIETYPNGQHADEARETLKDLRAKQEGHSLEQAIFDTIGIVTYDTPMALGNDYIMGRSLAQIVESSPAFPPVEGLPEEMWKNQSCKSCHSWTRESLCIQANNYVSMEPSRYREKQHPFDGMLKINLRNWAQNGCQ